MKASITIRCASKREAEALLRAISPDNLEAPPGLRVKARVSGCQLIAWIECRRGFGSFIATLDDLLDCLQAAERALQATKVGSS